MKGDKGKAPSVQWYFKDWLSDRQLQRARSSSRGIWMNLLMYMMDCPSGLENCDSGKLEYITIREICSLGGCTQDEAWDFIEDALQHGFCDVKLDKNETFHIISRRLSNDAEKRAKWREYKKNQRMNDSENNDENNIVSEMSTQSPPLSPIPTPIPITNRDDNKILWKSDFKVYLDQCRSSYAKLIRDSEWVCEQSRLNPGVHIQLTMEKAAKNFWATEEGWKHKKKKRAATINWKATWQNAIAQRINKVYKSAVAKDNGDIEPTTYYQCQDLESRQYLKMAFGKEKPTNGRQAIDQAASDCDQSAIQIETEDPAGT